MEYETIKLDIAFPGFRETQLKKMLHNGWKIIDKTVMNERYIYYVLERALDLDLNKCSNLTSNKDK